MSVVTSRMEFRSYYSNFLKHPEKIKGQEEKIVQAMVKTLQALKVLPLLTSWALRKKSMFAYFGDQNVNVKALKFEDIKTFFLFTEKFIEKTCLKEKDAYLIFDR